MYWSPAQQLAHHSINGCTMSSGDLLGTGTISGPERGSFGSMLEITWRGTQPLTLPNGQERKFINDGDGVMLRGYCEKEGVRFCFFQLPRMVPVFYSFSAPAFAWLSELDARCRFASDSVLATVSSCLLSKTLCEVRRISQIKLSARSQCIHRATLCQFILSEWFQSWSQQHLNQQIVQLECVRTEQCIHFGTLLRGLCSRHLTA
jgi:hypothetical protein